MQALKKSEEFEKSGLVILSRDPRFLSEQRLFLTPGYSLDRLKILVLVTLGVLLGGPFASASFLASSTSFVLFLGVVFWGSFLLISLLGFFFTYRLCCVIEFLFTEKHIRCSPHPDANEFFRESFQQGILRGFMPRLMTVPSWIEIETRGLRVYKIGWSLVAVFPEGMSPLFYLLPRYFRDLSGTRYELTMVDGIATLRET
ncbi:MAG: hypothetical protein ACKN9V_02765 [Pseudomonadota bacterium]